MCKSVLIVLVFVCAVAPVAAVSAEVNQQAIADVAAGKITVAKASWWGFDPVDSTEALQAAINSEVPTLIVDKAAGPWIVTPIELTSHQEIRFEKGVEVLAKRGEFQGTGDSLFTARLRENITLIGYWRHAAHVAIRLRRRPVRQGGVASCPELPTVVATSRSSASPSAKAAVTASISAPARRASPTRTS